MKAFSVWSLRRLINWGLRDYGTARWEGGSGECDHNGQPLASSKSTLAGYTSDDVKVRTFTMPQGAECAKCGARRFDSQIGLEPTPAEYVERIVSVFREIRRVLRKDGTVWLNLGDCYAGSWGAQSRPNGSDLKSNLEGGSMLSARQIAAHPIGTHIGSLKNTPNLKPKDLVGIPWRVAFALQADGWWLRSDIVWAKPNPMPESIRDRPTRAHEYVFLLTKSRRYFYDADAIREPMAQSSIQRINQPTFDSQNGGPKDYGHRTNENRSARKALCNLRESMIRQEKWGDRYEGWAERDKTIGANARTVWSIATEPFPEAHFATFPTELARRCILAGTSEAGACGKCGAPWARAMEREASTPARENYHGRGSVPDHRCGGDRPGGFYPNSKAIGFSPTCSCNAPASPSVVLDPFSGAGTVALVADTLGRDAIGLELNLEYVEMSRRRISAPRNEAAKVQAAMEDDGQMAMWGSNG